MIWSFGCILWWRIVSLLKPKFIYIHCWWILEWPNHEMSLHGSASIVNLVNDYILVSLDLIYMLVSDYMMDCTLIWLNAILNKVVIKVIFGYNLKCMTDTYSQNGICFLYVRVWYHWALRWKWMNIYMAMSKLYWLLINNDLMISFDFSRLRNIIVDIRRWLNPCLMSTRYRKWRNNR